MDSSAFDFEFLLFLREVCVSTITGAGGGGGGKLGQAGVCQVYFCPADRLGAIVVKAPPSERRI